MVERVEQARKVLAPLCMGRGRQAGLAKALAAVLDEAYERMEMAWLILNQPADRTEERQRFWAQKATELGMCYTLISHVFDELAVHLIIPYRERTQPTTMELARRLNQEDKKARRGSAE